jgi:hypothetical protein
MYRPVVARMLIKLVCSAMLTAHERLVIHEKSKDGGECTAASKMCPLFHLNIHIARGDGVGRKFPEQISIFR